MNILIASIILTIIASTYAILLKRQLAETFFLAVVTVVGVLYCFGLVNVGGCLLYGIYGLIALALGCVIFLIYCLINNKKLLLEIEIPQGCLLYIVLLAFSLFINIGEIFTYHDEFSHWGTIVKYFYSVDAMGTFDNLKYRLHILTYLPGTSLFQYFFARFSNQFIEWHSYVGMNVLYFSLFMPFIKDIFKKGKWYKPLILLIVFLSLPLQNFVQQNLYSSLLVDGILGAFFGFALLYYFIYKYEESLYGILMVSSAVFMLTFTKDMGLLFSLGIIGIIFIDIILYRRTQMLFFINKKPGLQHKSKAISLTIFPLISVLFVKFSWENLLQRTNIISLQTPTLNDIYMLFKGQVAPYQEEIAENFINTIKYQNININVISFCVIFLVIIVIFSIFGREKIKFGRMVTSSILLVAGMFIYQFVLMIMYVFYFSEYEGVNLASHVRYTSTYLLAMLIFMTFFCIPDQNEDNELNFKILFAKIKRMMTSNDFIKYKYISKSIYLLMCIAFCSYLFFYSITGRYGLANTLYPRRLRPNYLKIRPTTIAVNKWRSYFIDTKTYLLVQGNSSFAVHTIKYELCPDSDFANKMTLGDYNIAPESMNAWTFAVSPEEWEKYVLTNEFELIYVYKSNEQLVNTYGHFFPYGVQDDMLYRVQIIDGHMSLIPVIGNS